jgi:uncharacterized protein YecE (DUF72 family)
MYTHIELRAVGLHGDNITRYDYSYTRLEIEEIVRNIISLIEASHHVYLFANNHPRAQAVETICQIAHALDTSPALATL